MVLLVAVGVPLIVPVDVLNDNPVGNVALAVFVEFLRVYTNGITPPYPCTGIRLDTAVPVISDELATVCVLVRAAGDLIVRLKKSNFDCGVGVKLSVTVTLYVAATSRDPLLTFGVPVI